jgi:signal transduction histidine kinase
MVGPGFGEAVGLSEPEFSARLGSLCLENTPFPGVGTLTPTHTAPMPLDGDASGSVPLHEEDVAHPERLLIELRGPGHRVLDVRLRLADGENVSRILFFRDVTHEAEVDRMKSEFLSHAAHELRTPMASIFGFTELLRSRKMSEERRQDMLDVIHRQSLLMTAIINELLDLVRIDARRGEDFEFLSLDASTLVRAVVADYKVPEGRDPVVLDLPFTQRWVRADDNKLKRAVGNILSDAFKYSHAGAVEVSLVKGESTGLANAAPRVGIRVTDHGIGMTPEQLARVWERFYRADASGNVPGTGLGMAIVKEIIELHGGKAEVKSEFGVGTTVTLWLPAAAVPARLGA